MSIDEAERRTAIVAEAQTWIGTRYHHHGRIKGVGTDCAMYLAAVYHAVGLIPAVDPRPYPPDWHLHRDEERYLGWVTQYAHPVDQPGKGDVVLFRFGRCFAHGAIVLAWPTIIHAYMKEGGVVIGDAEKDHYLAMSGARPRPRAFYSCF